MVKDNGNRGTLTDRRSFIKGTASVATVVALAGCASNTGGNGGNGGKGGNGGNGKSGGVTNSLEWDHGKSIHFLGPTASSVWWRAMPMGNLIEAHKRDWDFSFSFPGWDPAVMNEAIVTQAQQNDALIVNPAAFGAHYSAIRKAKKKYNTPVAGNKDGIGKGVTHNILSADKNMGIIMAKDAIEWLKENRGGIKNKTIVHFQGDPDTTGWRLRAEGVQSIMNKYPGIDYIEVPSGATPGSWSEAANTHFATNSADAILTDSDGAYSYPIIQTLAKNDLLYRAGHPKHIYLGGVDGYPSSAMFVRRGVQTVTVPQTPFCITQNISKLYYKYILDKPTFQQSGNEIPQVPLDAKIGRPTDPTPLYWGESDEKLKMHKTDYGVPVDESPPKPYIIRRENVNPHNHWANVFPAWNGPTDLMSKTFNTPGDKPDYVEKLVSEFNTKLENGDYGKKIEYLNQI